MAEDYEDDNETTESYAPSAPTRLSPAQGEENEGDQSAYSASNMGSSQAAPPVQYPPRDTTGAMTPQRVAGPDSSHYTANVAGNRMQIVGGGNGAPRQMANVGGTMPQIPGQVGLSRAETMRLQKLQNGINAVQEKVASGDLSDAQGQQLIQWAQHQAAPLQKRQNQAQFEQIQQKWQAAQQDLGHQDGLQNMRDRQLAQAGPGKFFQIPGRQGMYALDQHGVPKITEDSHEEIKHRNKMEEIAAQKHDPAEEQRKAEEHERTDYERVFKMLTQDEVGADGKKTGEKIEPTHDEVEEFRSQRDVRVQGPHAYAAAILKKYPDGSLAPPAVKRRIFEIRHGLDTKGNPIP